MEVTLESKRPVAPSDNDEILRLMYGRPLVCGAPDAALILGISESLLWAKSNDNSAAYDPKFPQPIREYAGSKRTVWVTTELLLYVQSQALKRCSDNVGRAAIRVEDLRRVVEGTKHDGRRGV